MKSKLLLSLLLICGQLAAQMFSDEKSTTRALVIGISDYQEERIPDLRFADRDAQAFANFLQPPAGGSLPADKITLMTNKEAATGAIAAAMDWLIADSQEGNKVIIYFSGHGDVETRTKFQRGFLLTYDSPPSNYLAGAFALIFLQDIISTLSDLGVQVVKISDACRAGKLAGSEIGGVQAITANLLAFKAGLYIYDGNYVQALDCGRQAVKEFRAFISFIEKLAANDISGASAYLEGLIQKFPGSEGLQYILCQVKTELGENDSALDYLEGAVVGLQHPYAFIQNDPMLASLRGTTRY